MLVAQTGSVVVSLAQRRLGGRFRCCRRITSCSARQAQLQRDLPAAFAALREKYGASYPSFISVITGPSRTGDIEAHPGARGRTDRGS